MTSMREKIAMAIYEAWAKAKGTDATWDEVASGANDMLPYPALKETYELAFAEADAVLDALMEPTEGRVAAMDEHSGTIAPEFAYQAGIQAAKDGA